MRNSMFRFLAVATALALAPALAAAKGPHGNPHGGGGAKFSDHDSDDREKHAKGHGDHDRDDDRDGDHDRDDRGRPPGWSKGKKTGWGNCDVPPGHNDDLVTARGQRLFHSILDDRLVHQREHLFRLGLGGRQKTRAQSGSRKNSFTNPHFHWRMS